MCLLLCLLTWVWDENTDRQQYNANAEVMNHIYRPINPPGFRKQRRDEGWKPKQTLTDIHMFQGHNPPKWNTSWSVWKLRRKMWWVRVQPLYLSLCLTEGMDGGQAAVLWRRRRGDEKKWAKTSEHLWYQKSHDWNVSALSLLHICCMNSSSETLDSVCRSFSLARGSGCGHTDVTVTSVSVW